jgi:hypothetical protein
MSEAYALDAAGQRVVVGDHVMASLPNIPATRRVRSLYPCKVMALHDSCFHLLYVGKDTLLRRWTTERFMRWRSEVVKADISGLGLDDEEDAFDACACCSSCCRRIRIDCDGD